MTNAVIVELEVETPAPADHDRRRALVVAFAICLAVGAAAVGRDGPAATAPTQSAGTVIYGQQAWRVAGARVLNLPPGTFDARLFTMPDRLANEPLANLPFVEVRIRGTEGLGIRVGSPEGAWIMWTEDGTAYWLSSEHRDLDDLVDLAGSLR